MNDIPPKRRGRKDRMALRAAPPLVNPCPPGQSGGQYRPLSDADCAAIHATALRLLSDLGMGEVPDVLIKPMTDAGAVMRDGRLYFPPALVARAIKLAAKRFTHPGRDPARSITLGGDAVHFGTGGAAVQVLDIDSARYRDTTLRDLYDFTRLQDQLTNVSWFTRCCIATDVADPWLLDANTLFALLKGTTKPVATAFTLPEHVAPLVRMAEMAMDVPFVERPFLKAHISPIISPMRFGEDAVAVTIECLKHGIPVSCITAAQSGATAPATLAGFLAQSHAETLASLVMVNVLKPGHPMVFSNWPLVIDLRSGAFAGGGGEISVLNAASAQVTRSLGLPAGVASSMTDAKVPDAQYGMEKALSSLAAGLSGANLVYESAGMMASLLGASFEAFVLDDEMLAHVYRMLRGVEVSEDTLGYDSIVEAVMGEGHFLGGAQTLVAMERDYFYPAMSDRQTPRAWEEEGRVDAWTRANARARELLAKPDPGYVSQEAEARIRDAYDIRLDVA